MAAASATNSAPISKQKERTPLGDALRQLFKNKLAVVSLSYLIILAVLVMAADYLHAYTLQGYEISPNVANYDNQVLPDNYALPGEVSTDFMQEGFVYWLGADRAGRDLWTRTLYGGRVSLAVALVAGAVSLFIGVVYGLIAGYIGGRVDDIMMRIVDFLYGVPTLIVVILLQVYFKALDRNETESVVAGWILDLNQALGGLLFVFIALGALSWLSMARIARGQTLAAKKKEYVEAAMAIGVSTPAIIFRQILPNILGPCIVQETLQIPGYILTEAFLSFIGLGVDPPTPSWGLMINDGAEALRSYPHVLFPPAIALTVTVLAFNFLGDGLRDAFDPRQRQ